MKPSFVSRPSLMHFAAGLALTALAVSQGSSFW